MRKALVAIACFALLAAAAFGQGVIKLGANWPLADVSGMECSRAAQLAVDEINKAGGVLGKQLQLIVVDDEGKGDKGVAAIEKLATVDKVDVLLGGIASGVAVAQVPTMKKYQIVTVATGAAASASVEKALGPSPGLGLVLPSPSLGLRPGPELRGRMGRHPEEVPEGENQAGSSLPTRRARSESPPSMRQGSVRHPVHL